VLAPVPTSSKTWARQQLGVGYAVKDALFLARKQGAAVKLSSKCPGCGRWGSLTRPASSLDASFEPRRVRSPELLELVHRLRCIGCGIHPFAGAETIPVRRVKQKNSQGGDRRPTRA
jgi:hypothetical protein